MIELQKQPLNREYKSAVALFGYAFLIPVFILFFASSSVTFAKTATLTKVQSGGTDLVRQSQNIPYGPERDLFMSNHLAGIPGFTSTEVRDLVSLAARNGLSIVTATLPKTSPLAAVNLVEIVDGLKMGTDRDTALLTGAKLIKSADVQSIKIAIGQAYIEKLQVMNLLTSKTTNLSTDDLGFLAKDISTADLRDQILAAGLKFLRVFGARGLAEMVHKAGHEKMNLARAVLPRVDQLTASDFALILIYIEEGADRDQLISESLRLVKKMDGIGAGAIIERAVANKGELGMTLFKMIPNASGTALDQILAGCSSGTVRDQILGPIIPLLGTITKGEALALHRRSYQIKDATALSLMAKVDEFDGLFIAEMASLSLKAKSRDLIIAEGLKRLKAVDVPGLIAMIKVADKMVEVLALQTAERIPEYSSANAIEIVEVLHPNELINRFLIRAVSIIVDIDEPAITLLALAANTPIAKNEIVQTGVARIENNE